LQAAARSIRRRVSISRWPTGSTAASESGARTSSKPSCPSIGRIGRSETARPLCWRTDSAPYSGIPSSDALTRAAATAGVGAELTNAVDTPRTIAVRRTGRSRETR
jgi:hypothetical protein